MIAPSDKTKAQFVTKRGRVVRFEVPIIKRRDGMMGPPITLTVIGRNEKMARFCLMGYAEKIAHYRLPGKFVVPIIICNQEAFTASLNSKRKIKMNP